MRFPATIAALLFAGAAAAQEYSPISVTGPIALERGTLTLNDPEAIYLNDADGCRLLVDDNGWEESDCAFIDRVIFFPTPAIDNLIVENPITDGHVKFDDWDKADRDDEIEAIWDGLSAALEAQSANLGVPITAEKWRTYPTLDRQRNVLYYAYLLNWNGQPVVNVKASFFDRKGYVIFGIVPAGAEPTDAEIRRIVFDLADRYRGVAGERYADFKMGDHVAEAGAVGVLATMVGVKYGKEIAGGLLAAILLFAKKAWFLILIPLVWLGRLFRRRGD